MAKTVAFSFTVKPQTFPEGVAEGQYKIDIVDSTGAVIKTASQASTAAFVIDNIPGGTYNAVITKNGVAVSKSFTVPVPTFQVPDLLTITVQ